MSILTVEPNNQFLNVLWDQVSVKEEIIVELGQYMMY